MLDIVKTRFTEGEQERPSRAQKSAPQQRQVVLVFQGGGALGAYQAGVYQALHEAKIEPDWIIGTSIGAINASLIAGNEPENRLERLDGGATRLLAEPVAARCCACERAIHSKNSGLEVMSH